MFPSRVPVPDVLEKRKERIEQLASSCLRGIILRSLIILVEMIGFVLFGSYALMLDGLASLLDVFSSIFLLISMKFAARPPDENHPFGHGRVEPLVGLQLGIFMVLVGVGMLFQQIFAFAATPKGESIDSRAWMISLFALILLEICYQITMRTAKRQHSPALAADALHYRIDGITSLFATIALITAAYFPDWGAGIDHVGAISITLLMIGMGINAVRQNLHQILDRMPQQEYFNRVLAAAKRVQGVLGTEKILIQVYGPDAHVDIDIEVDPKLSVEKAHLISQNVRAEIQKEWPLVQDVIVHIEPFYPGDH